MPSERMIQEIESDHGPVLGSRLREMRKERGLSLKQLADASGVSAGMLSLIERNLANPSLRVVTGIRIALNVPLSSLFSASENVGPVVDPSFVRRASNRPQLSVVDARVEKELLSSSDAVNVQVALITIAPGGGSNASPMSYPAEKAGFVLEGKLSLTVGGVPAVLNSGDSFQFDSSLPHTMQNDTDAPTKFIWIIARRDDH